MVENLTSRTIQWDSNLGEDFEFAKKAILLVLKDQKVSLSKTRALFNCILNEIEDSNPITYYNTNLPTNQSLDM